jgi:hypothetical protein
MLKLRTIGLSDYSVLEGRQRIGRIRLTTERMPCVWLWAVTVHLTGGLPMGSSKDLDTAKAEFKAAWDALPSFWANAYGVSLPPPVGGVRRGDNHANNITQKARTRPPRRMKGQGGAGA